MLSNIVLASPIHQHISATGVHMSGPSWTPHPHLPPHPTLPGYQSTGFSSLCHTAHFHFWHSLHVIMYLFPCCFLSSSHPLLPLLCPQVCFLHLHLLWKTWCTTQYVRLYKNHIFLGYLLGLIVSTSSWVYFNLIFPLHNIELVVKWFLCWKKYPAD